MPRWDAIGQVKCMKALGARTTIFVMPGSAGKAKDAQKLLISESMPTISPAKADRRDTFTPFLSHVQKMKIFFIEQHFHT